MVDPVTVFVMERLVVFIASGDVVADPDFGSAPLFLDEPGGFSHEQIEGEAGQCGSGGGDLFFNAGNFQNGVGVGNVVVDGDVGKFVSADLCVLPSHPPARELPQRGSLSC